MRVAAAKAATAKTAALITVLAAVGAGREARAGKAPEDVFQGEVAIVTKRIPFRFRNDGEFVRFIKSNRVRDIWPEKKEKDRWKFDYMSFFAKPLDDVQVQIRIVDVTEKTPRFVATFEQFTSERGQRILSSNLELTKPEFQPNREYRMEVMSRGRVIARSDFRLRGEGERHSGKVVFTEEETRE